MDFKLGKPQTEAVKRGLFYSNWSIRLRYAYTFPQFSKSYDGFQGNMQYITVGIGGVGRKFKRDY